MYRWIAFPLAAALAGGCQTYRAEPLDSESMLGDWEARSLALAAGEMSAQPTSDAPRVIELAEAEPIALAFNPQLRRARLEANAARVSGAEAGRWDDPSIGIDVEHILSGVDKPWVVGGLVNLTIPFSGRLRIEKSLALTESDVAKLRVLWQERQTIAELRRTWAAWSAATERARVIQNAIADLSAIESATDKLLDAGEIDPTEARLFTIDLVRQRVRLLDANRDAARLDARLRQLIGLTPTAPVVFAASDGMPPNSERVDVEAHPRLLIAKQEYAVAERSLELQINRQYPDLQIGGGFGRDTGDERLLGGLSIPIPILNANRREIAEAQARRDVLRAAYEAELIDLATSRAMAEVETQAAQASLEAIERDFVPLVQRQVAEARQLLAAGEFNALVLREAIDTATDVHLDLITARHSLAIARVEQLLLNETTSATRQAPQ
jgi:cobalt-zinc-cadmium efflux system outer membrane protein